MSAAYLSPEKIVRPDPGWIAYCYTKGEAFYYAFDDAEEALASYEQNIDLFPDDADMYNDKGIALEYFGRHEEALVVFEQVVCLAPTAAAHFHKGRVLSALGRYEEALAAHERAIFLNPKDGSIHFSKGCLLFDLGRYQQATAAFEMATRLGNLRGRICNNSDAPYNKGKALICLGRYEDALAAFERANAFDDSSYNSDIDIQKGYVLCKLNRFEEALTLYEDIISICPCATHYYLKARMLFDLKRYDEASDAFRESLHYDYRDADAWRGWGDTFEQLGEPEMAQRCYREAEYIDSHPK